MEGLLPSWEHPTESDALAIQQALWDNRLMRVAAAFDCLIAAYAVVNDAVILNSDHDFEYLESATGGVVRQEYVAAR
jgi:predicted nucleic acid-binding protein